MDRFGSHHTGEMLFADQHLSANGNRCVYAAYRLDAQCTVTVDVRHDHANFIHVGADHQLVRRTILSTFFHQQTAQRVDCPGHIVPLFQHGDQIAAYSLLIAGYSAKITQGFKMIKHTLHLLR